MIILYSVIAAIVGSLVILGCINITRGGVANGNGIELESADDIVDDIVGVADEAVIGSGA